MEKKDKIKEQATAKQLVNDKKFYDSVMECLHKRINMYKALAK